MYVYFPSHILRGFLSLLNGDGSNDIFVLQKNECRIEWLMQLQYVYVFKLSLVHFLDCTAALIAIAIVACDVHILQRRNSKAGLFTSTCFYSHRYDTYCRRHREAHTMARCERKFLNEEFV